jgi:hypothetical protein
MGQGKAVWYFSEVESVLFFGLLLGIIFLIGKKIGYYGLEMGPYVNPLWKVENALVVDKFWGCSYFWLFCVLFTGQVYPSFRKYTKILDLYWLGTTNTGEV